MSRPWSPQQRGKGLDIEIEQVLADPIEALKLIQVIPGWNEDCVKELQVKQISGAMTNLVFQCYSPKAQQNKTVIVRIFGRGEKLFSHQQERAIFIQASSLGLGPRCLVEFPSARVEEFLPGAVLTAGSMQLPCIAAAIAHSMAAFHLQMLPAAAAAAAPSPGPECASLHGSNTSDSSCGSDVGGEGECEGGPGAIWGRVRRWHAVAAEVAPAEVAALGLKGAVAEVLQLQGAMLQRFPTWLGFCHNDLQYGNMLLFDRDGDGLQREDGAQHSQQRRPAQGQQQGWQQPQQQHEVQPLPSLAEQQQAQQRPLSQMQHTPPQAEQQQQAYQHTQHTQPQARQQQAAEGGLGGPSGGVSPCCAAQPSVPPPCCCTYQRCQEEGGYLVRLIDYEYATLNDVAFDVANHWCEYVYDYHGDRAHEVHAALFPSRQQQQAFCREYLGAVYRLAYPSQAPQQPSQPMAPQPDQPDDRGQQGRAQERCSRVQGLGASGMRLAAAILGSEVGGGCGGGGGEAAQQHSCAAGERCVGGGGPSEGVVELLVRKALAYTPLAHLKWSLWGLIQSKTSKCDFDYLEYARQRVALYHAAKEAYLQ